MVGPSSRASSRLGPSTGRPRSCPTDNFIPIGSRFTPQKTGTSTTGERCAADGVRAEDAPSNHASRSAARGSGATKQVSDQRPASGRNPPARASRLLTAAEFHQLADVPPEVEWFANLSNPHTRRAYENAVTDFMRFTGIDRPEEFRTVTRAHIIAWRDELVRRGLGGSTIRHRLASLASLFEYLCEKNAVTHNPVKGVERPKTESGEGKTPALGDHQARKLLDAPAGRHDQEQARPRHSLHAAVPRAAARGAVQAQGQGFPARAQRRAASQGVRQRRQDALSAAASRHPRAHPRLSRRRRSRRR